MINNYNPVTNVIGGGSGSVSIHDGLLNCLDRNYGINYAGTRIRTEYNRILQTGGTSSLGTYVSKSLTGKNEWRTGSIDADSFSDGCYIDIPIILKSNNLTCYLAVETKVLSGTANVRLIIMYGNRNVYVDLPNNGVALFNLTKSVETYGTDKIAIIYQAVSRTSNSHRETLLDFIITPNV